ncbi:MAG: tetratricopeptide repeat protein [Lachnospiraceae bacterium]|nr:tetratricopeptide repeat protein [Lachnospiraceae bacterium]
MKNKRVFFFFAVILTMSFFMPGCSIEKEKRSLREEGIAYMGAGDYQSAENSFLTALSVTNGIVRDIDIDISYYLGVCEYKQGRYDDAEDTFSAIIGIDDDEEDAWYMRGKVRLTKGDKSAALSDFDRAVELEPSRYVLYQKIYMDLCDAGFEGDANAYIGKAVSENEKMSDYQHGVFSYYMGDFDEARNYLEKARGKSKDDARLIIYLGRCYDALDDPEYAQTLYQTWLDSNEADAAMLNELGLVKLKLSDLPGALSSFQKGIELDDAGSMQSLRFNEIVTYERMGEFSKAKTGMESYISAYPADEDAKREYEFLKTR